jgi:hypothetical protein
MQTSTLVAATKTMVMTTFQKTLITAALVVTVGAGIFEARQAARLNDQIKLLQQQQAPLAEQIGQLKTRNESLSQRLTEMGEAKKLSEAQFRELLKLRGQLGQQQELNTKTAENNSRAAFVKDWLAREDQLKQLVQQYPDKTIPELKLLSEQQWLYAAMKAKTDTDKDVQETLANLRREGEGNFATLTHDALSGYMKANNGQFPTDISQLKEYFSPPLDDAILQRWEVAPASANPGVGVGDAIITEKSPVDASLDSHWAIGANGYGSSSYSATEQQAALAVIQPVVKAYAADNNGNDPTDPSQILPYLKTPQQKAAYKILLKNQAALQK